MSALDDILDNKPTSQPQQAPATVSQPTVQPQQGGTAPLVQNQQETGGVVRPAPPMAPPTKPSENTPTQTGMQLAENKEMPKRVTMQELIDKYSTNKPVSKEQMEAEDKRAKREKLFAAISDGISAMSNLYFTTKGAPNMYDKENSQLKRVESKWEKHMADRNARMNAYIADLMRAKQADEAYEDNERKWKRQIGLDEYNKKKDADAIQYKKDRDAAKDHQWQQEFDQKDNQFKTSTGIKQNAQKETERHNRANEGIARAGQAETKRHNRTTEAQGAARIGIERGKNGGKGGKQETIRLNDGSVHAYTPDKKGALSGFSPAMIKKARAAAERYKKAGDRNSANHYRAIAEALEGAGSKEQIAAIVAANIGDFPSMDSDVRSAMGISGGFDPTQYRRNGNSKPGNSTGRPPLN